VAVGTYARSTGCIQVGVTPLQPIPSAQTTPAASFAAPVRAPCTCQSSADDDPAPKKLGLQVYELAGPELKLVQEVEKRDGFKCATFGAAAPASQQLATGSFKGRLQVWDLGAPAAPVFDAQAHASIINAVDGFGGRTRGCGPPEIATGGRDGCVRVWDVRQPDAPVAAFEPADSGGARWVPCMPRAHGFGALHSRHARACMAAHAVACEHPWQLGCRTRCWWRRMGLRRTWWRCMRPRLGRMLVHTRTQGLLGGGPGQLAR
jgi:hypothetical protein